MPQLVFRVVSQVPADATDIRDASDAGLARIDALRFRASALRVAAIVLAVLAAIVAASALPALLGRLRGGRRRAETPVSDHAVLQAVATRLDALVDANPTGDLDAAAVAEAHHLVRVVAGIAAGHGVRQAPLARGAGSARGPDRRGRLAGTRPCRGDVERDGRDREPGDRGVAGFGRGRRAGTTRGPR